jgi:hypothetical protein
VTHEWLVFALLMTLPRSCPKAQPLQNRILRTTFPRTSCRALFNIKKNPTSHQLYSA